MREGTNRLRIGALLLGVGLAFGVAAPALAQSVPGAEVSEDDNEATITTDEYVITADDPSTIEAVDTRTPEEQFVAGFLDCVGDDGISECTEEVLIDIGLEEEDDEVEEDLTPYNPIDEGSIETTDEVELEFGPPGV